MTKFNEWCIETEVAVPKHRLKLLESEPAKLAHAVDAVATALPNT